jgi:NADH-quinone oxidoreductase subunit I
MSTSPATQAPPALQETPAITVTEAPPPAPYPTTTRPYRQSVAERLYLPLVGGLMVTLRHFLRNLFHPGRMLTIEYPEERRNYSHRFRGHHILTTRPDGSLRCVACYLCAQACPAECIHIEAAEHPDVNIEKYPVVYEIDMLRCVFCGYCVDACPEEAIIMSNNYDMAYFNRDQTIVGKADLMKPYTFDEGQLGYRPRYPEEEAERAKMRREEGPAGPRVGEGTADNAAPAAVSAPPASGSPVPPAPRS